jgi:hypothetical protein
MNPPDATELTFSYIGPLLQTAGVQIDPDRSGNPRWLPDMLAWPGIVRQFAHVPAFREQMHAALELAIGHHKPELIVLMDHTHCGDRGVWFQTTYGRPMTAAEERELIALDLNQAAAMIRVWQRQHAPGAQLAIELAVGIVNGDAHACTRRLTEVVSLADYLRNAPVPT